MWSCWRGRGEEKKRKKKNTQPERREHPGWTRGGGLSVTVARFESLFVSLRCLFMQGHMWRTNSRGEASGRPGGEISTKEVSRKIQHQAQLAARNANSDFAALYIVFENGEYRLFCIYYQPLGALKKEKKRNVIQTTTWTIWGVDKSFFFAFFSFFGFCNRD